MDKKGHSESKIAANSLQQRPHHTPESTGNISIRTKCAIQQNINQHYTASEPTTAKSARSFQRILAVKPRASHTQQLEITVHQRNIYAMSAGQPKPTRPHQQMSKPAETEGKIQNDEWVEPRLESSRL
ncbi:hypothetical protein Nepgr_023082 [Nepenthes gracilis]|uniref:Uncharacterized protein n=1 Tax=Nepenthes gracilis TaxID=150966 RepID=A0AAD3XYR9_NEPGR|nr:hypothetical protein Nepgr_023082 [Nepenthes gracilis]